MVDLKKRNAMERKLKNYIKEANDAYMRREASIVAMLALIQRCKVRITLMKAEGLTNDIKEPTNGVS